MFSFGTYDTIVRSLVNPQNRRVFITLTGRLELLRKFPYILLHFPNNCHFFCFSVDLQVQQTCCYISPASVLTRNRLNQCPENTTRQSTSYFIILFAKINFNIYHVFRGTITHHPNFDHVHVWIFRRILPESTSSSESKKCSSKQTAENRNTIIGTSQWTCPNFSKCCHFIFHKTLNSWCVVVISYY